MLLSDLGHVVFVFSSHFFESNHLNITWSTAAFQKPIEMLRRNFFPSCSLSRFPVAAIRSLSTDAASSSAYSAAIDWSKFYGSTSTPAALATAQLKRRRFLPTFGGDSALVRFPLNFIICHLSCFNFSFSDFECESRSRFFDQIQGNLCPFFWPRG
jgi:hypothetical protein